MKVNCSIFIPLALHKMVYSDADLAPMMPKNGADIFLSWPSLLFTKIMDLSKLKRVTVSCRFTPDEDEINQVDWYTLAPDSFCATNSKDEKWRENFWNNLPFVKGSDRVRHYPEYRISKIRNLSNKIICLGGAFYCVPVQIMELFKKNEITGVVWRDIFDLKGEIKYEHCKLLMPESLIGPAERNLSMEYNIGASDGDYKDYAFLIPHAGVRSFSRSALKNAKDINLTTEPMSGYNVGSVIVSRRVKELIEKEKIKGVFFEPVLISDTPLYQKFIEQWSQFEVEIKNANSENRIN